MLGRVRVAESVRDALNGAPCAVAFAPAGYAQRTGPIGEIGAGYDGSPESVHALDVARELAARHGAKLSACEVIDFPTLLPNGRSAVDGTQIEAALEDARERITALGGIESHAAYGKPGEELALYSASVDLLVVGSRGYDPIGRLVHGSVARHLVHSSRCPLLVLPKSAHAEELDVDADTRSVAAATH